MNEGNEPELSDEVIRSLMDASAAVHRLQREPDHEVEVYCADDRHTGRRVTVQVFHHISGGWAAVDLRSQKRPRESGTRVSATGKVWGPWISPDEPDDLHWVYNLECTLCPRPRPNLQIRAERFHPALDLLTEAGVSQMSLAALAATLG